MDKLFSKKLLVLALTAALAACGGGAVPQAPTLSLQQQEMVAVVAAVTRGW
ncbi:hypothetical protein [Microbulbifer sp. GL-2]|uniref:hypothetical protein n=1 Tax=Microbulbifer sp. GL-2 TaxID=2591606 RepID=UPI001E409A2C|nr:hypothetical protein [Microbulbifer sp. GL-2]